VFKLIRAWEDITAVGNERWNLEARWAVMCVSDCR